MPPETDQSTVISPPVSQLWAAGSALSASAPASASLTVRPNPILLLCAGTLASLTTKLTVCGPASLWHSTSVVRAATSAALLVSACVSSSIVTV